MVPRFKRMLHRQLDPEAGPRGRLSPLNRFLVGTIVLAVIAAVAETEPELTRGHGKLFAAANLLFGMVFAVEYLARLWLADTDDRRSPFRARLKFVVSIGGLIDLVTVASSLLPVIGFNSTPLRIVRIVRIVRLARLGRFSRAVRYVTIAVASRSYELLIASALAGVVLLVGSTALYWIEADVQPDKFGSIPRAMWWSIETLTTVGYGDVYPVTPLGKFIAGIIALAGIGVIALPAGILAAAFSDVVQRDRRVQLPEGGPVADAQQ